MALQCFRKCVDLDPDCALGQCNLGGALSNEGHLEEALKCFDECLQRDPGNKLCHANRGCDGNLNPFCGPQPTSSLRILVVQLHSGKDWRSAAGCIGVSAQIHRVGFHQEQPTDPCKDGSHANRSDRVGASGFRRRNGPCPGWIPNHDPISRLAACFLQLWTLRH